MKRTHTFIADDGTEFATAAECKRYEETKALSARLSDLSFTEIANAISRLNLDLAAAIERAGSIIAAKRRESGELKRAAKGQGGASTFDGAVKAIGNPGK